MVKINLKTPADVAKNANKIEGLHSPKTQNGFFVLISERLKAFFLKIKL